MTDATLERGGTTITLPLTADSGGTPLVSHDVGKPEAGISGGKGVLDPRWSDRWSRTETYTLIGQFTSASAYDDAIALADLIKSHSGGDPITLNIGMPEFDTDISVVPPAAQGRALELAYDPGGTDMVGVELTLVRIEYVTASSTTQTASTPTGSGSGPVQLTDGSTTVSFEADIVVDRTIGRPNSVIRRTTKTYHRYSDKLKNALDEFELGVEFTTSAQSQIADLKSLVRPARGRSALTLDFQGEYGLGSFDVVPTGSGALRTVRPAGEEGTVIVPSLTLRKVTT